MVCSIVSRLTRPAQMSRLDAGVLLPRWRWLRSNNSALGRFALLLWLVPAPDSRRIVDPHLCHFQHGNLLMRVGAFDRQNEAFGSPAERLLYVHGDTPWSFHTI